MNSVVQQINLSDGWTGEVYHEWKFTGEVIEKWNSLAAEYGDKGIFLSYDWFENWWYVFGSEQELFVVILKKSGVIKAVFPCSISSPSQENRREKYITAISNSHTCYFDFVISPEVRKEALHHFLKLVYLTKPESSMFFDYLPSSGDTVTVFINVLKEAHIPFYKYSQPWAPLLNVLGDWKVYHSNLPGRLKNTIRRNLKKIETDKKMDFEIVESSTAIDEILNAFFEIESSNWKGKQGTAIKCQPHVENFYRLLCHWAMKQKSLLIFILKIEGEPVATNLCLRSGQTVFLLKPGYHASYKHLSPGNLLHHEMVKYMFKSPGIIYYDFLGACDTWKMEWTSQTNQTGWLRIYPKSISGWASYFIHYGWKDILKQSDMIIRLKTWLGQKGLRSNA